MSDSRSIRDAIDEAQGADLDAGRPTAHARHAYRVAALDALLHNLDRAQAALAEIEAKPYRAEEVTARYRRETQ